MPHHCHRSFNILVYARVNRISIGIRTCPPNLEKSCSSKCIGKHGETFVFSHRYRNLTQVSMKPSEPYHWYDLTTVHLPVIRQGYKWIHFREVAKQMWALVLADLELLQAQNSEKNTQKYRLKDSKTNQSGGAVEKLRQTDTFSRHGHEICLSSGFTGFGKACSGSYTRNASTLMNPMSLLNRMSSHANRPQGAWLQSSKTSSHSKRSVSTCNILQCGGMGAKQCD